MALVAATSLTALTHAEPAEEPYRPNAKAVVTKDAIHIDEGVDYALPSDSGLTFVKLAEEWSVATFSGRITLHGTYYYGQLSDSPGDDLIDLYFMPDAKDARHLPSWRQNGPVREIIFQNGDAFVKAVIPAKIAAAVKNGRRKSARGRATIVAEGFEIGVSCGAPFYVTRFDSLAVTPKLFAARKTVERTTC
jgi:hypothetical protein